MTLRRSHSNELKAKVAFEAIKNEKTLNNEVALEIHLNCIHLSRVKLVMLLLPDSKVIIDLGGANCPLHHIGYPYKFDSLTVVDLPPQNRFEEYRDKIVKEENTLNGPIFTLFTSMTDLSDIKNDSVDLVWAGQSIEHLTEDDLDKVFLEVWRILKPGGYFCFDTPNRLITEIHAGINNFINPDHKKEYYPNEIRNKIINSGFLIEEEKGLCEMFNSYQTKQFDYNDFVTGNQISNNVEISYIQYYKCKKHRKSLMYKYSKRNSIYKNIKLDNKNKARTYIVQFVYWFIKRSFAWLTFSPGSRPRRIIDKFFKMLYLNNR